MNPRVLISTALLLTLAPASAQACPLPGMGRLAALEQKAAAEHHRAAHHRAAHHRAAPTRTAP